jgi:hypothetical protein
MCGLSCLDPSFIPNLPIKPETGPTHSKHGHGQFPGSLWHLMSYVDPNTLLTLSLDIFEVNTNVRQVPITLLRPQWLFFKSLEPFGQILALWWAKIGSIWWWGEKNDFQHHLNIVFGHIWGKYKCQAGLNHSFDATTAVFQVLGAFWLSDEPK